MNREKAIVVTGASRGVGAAVARWLGKEGCRVALAARSAAPLQEVARDVEALGGEALPLAADVSDPESCRRVVSQALARWGRLDGLVNNAGMLEPVSRIADADPAAWRYNIEVNLLGPFYFVRAAIAELRKSRGRIVNVSTGAATQPLEIWSAYCASKAGLTHFTRVLALEERSVTSVAVRPGVVDTRMQETIREEASLLMPPERAAYFKNLKASGGLEPPEVPGRSIAWLALHAPSQWSGEFLNYDDAKVDGPARKALGEELNVPAKTGQ